MSSPPRAPDAPQEGRSRHQDHQRPHPPPRPSRHHQPRAAVAEGPHPPKRGGQHAPAHAGLVGGDGRSGPSLRSRTRSESRQNQHPHQPQGLAPHERPPKATKEGQQRRPSRPPPAHRRVDGKGGPHSGRRESRAVTRGHPTMGGSTFVSSIAEQGQPRDARPLPFPMHGKLAGHMQHSRGM